MNRATSAPPSGLRRLLTGRFARRSLLALAALAVSIQAVPYGRDHTNPPVTGTPQWDSPHSEQLVQRACASCHSNQTEWPWYASVAPISWRVQSHVDEGRAALNFSEMDRGQKEAKEAAEVVASGEMPLWDFVMMHPEAKLSTQERADLVAGLKATFGGGKSASRDDDD